MHRFAGNNRGFTLIEILVVIAISMILMGLVIGPVIQSFSLTRQAQAMIDAQDSARHGMETIGRELGEAMFVFDNAETTVAAYDDGTTPAYLTTGNTNTAGPIQLPVRQPGGGPSALNIQCFTLPYGKIDMILPKITMHCNNPAHDTIAPGTPRDYDRGMEALPPCPNCNSSDVEARPRLPLEQDQTIVRYFLGLKYNNPNVTDPTTLRDGEGVFGWMSPFGGDVSSDDQNQVVLYRAEFKPGDETLFPPNTEGLSAAAYQARNLQDPVFFYRTANNSNGVPCCVEWAKRAQVIGVGKYQDLVSRPDKDILTGPVTDIEPSITFRFSKVDNDPLSGQDANGATFEYPDTAPTVYDAANGYWSPVKAPASRSQVTLYRDNNRVASTTQVQGGDLMIVKREASGGVWSDPAPVFNMDQYLRDGTISSGSQDTPVEMAFTIDENRGRVNCSLVPPKPNGQSWPTVISAGQIASINQDFHDHYSGSSARGIEADAGSAIRFALLNTFDSNGADPGRCYLQNAHVVPGSDKVVGPDMTPGSDHTRLVTYQRVPVTLGDPGLNQYKMYCDIGRIEFSSAYDQDLPVNVGDSPDTPRIFINYRICFNEPADVLKANYTTKSLVTVHLGMRMFDPDTGKLHAVDLNNSVKVGNSYR